MFRLKALDYIIFLFFTALVVLSAIQAAEKNQGKTYAEVEASGKKYILPLDTDREITVPGPVGKTRISIAEGQVAILHSDCPNKTCMAAGAISSPSAWIACLPNRVFIRIVNSRDDSSEGEVDAGSF